MYSIFSIFQKVKFDDKLSTVLLQLSSDNYDIKKVADINIKIEMR